ncbi:MAG: hypothetical protein AAGP08_00020 [Pseudomonadota bacterium]
MNAQNGIRAHNLAKMYSAEAVVAVGQGTAGQLEFGALAARIGAQIGPNYETQAALFGDLSWPAGARAVVWDDPNDTLNGLYRKSGDAGTGAWTYDGPNGLNLATQNAQTYRDEAAAERLQAEQAAAATAADRTSVATLASLLPAAYFVAAFSALPGSASANEVAMIFADETAGGLATLRRYDGSDWDDVYFLDPKFSSLTVLSAAPGGFPIGEIVRAGEFAYRVVADNGDLVTAGGAHLEALPLSDGWYVPDQFAPNVLGATNMTAAVLKALGKGRVRGYLGVPGEYLVDALPLANGATLDNIDLRLTAFGAATIAIDVADRDRVSISRLRLDLGDDQTNGGALDGSGKNGFFKTAFGIRVDGATNLRLQSIEVTGAGSMTAIDVQRVKQDTIIDDIYVHDIAFHKTTLIEDDVFQAFRLINSEGVTVTRLRVARVTNTKDGNHKYSRGIVFSGNRRCTLTSGSVEYVDQGVDFTGSGGNIDCTISDFTAYLCYSVCYKWSSSCVRCRGHFLTGDGAGRANYIFSGPAEEGLSNKTMDIILSACTSIDPGKATNEFVEADRTPVGFYIEKSNANQNHPRGVHIVDCVAIDDFGLQNFAVLDDTIPIQGDQPNRVVRLTTDGNFLVEETRGVREDYQFNGGGGQDIPYNAWTPVLFTNTPHDDQGARGVVTTLGSEDCYYAAPATGPVRADYILFWGQNATGLREARLSIDGVGEIGVREQVANGEHMTTKHSEKVFLKKGQKLRLEAKHNIAGGGNLSIALSASVLKVTPQ